MHRILSILALVGTLFFAALTPAQATQKEAWISVSKTGTGPALILIPGLSSSSDVWSKTARHLSNRYTVYQVQIKGFAGMAGEMGMDKGGLLDGLTEALGTYIRDNALGQPPVIGHSMGGFLALRLQRDYPAQIGKTIIVDALPFYSLIVKAGATEENMKPIAEGFRAQIIAGAKMDPVLRRKAQQQMLTRLVTDQDGLETIVEWSMKSDAKIVGQAVFELMTSDIRGALPKMTSPTLVLAAWAPGGPYTKAQTLGFWQHHYAAHPNAQVQTVSPARHFIMLDQPEIFFGKVDAFLTK
jgi:pimeloyl-ACP methyl ester carboxylesterase